MSSDTMWFDREPGSNVARGRTDPNSLLVGADVPDWVRLPRELGGAKVRVKGAVAAPCPSPECGHHNVRHLILETINFAVAECEYQGFLWYVPQPKEKTDDTTE